MASCVRRKFRFPPGRLGEATLPLRFLRFFVAILPEIGLCLFRQKSLNDEVGLSE
jgi:hypothetical protein